LFIVAFFNFYSFSTSSCCGCNAILQLSHPQARSCIALYQSWQQRQAHERVCEMEEMASWCSDANAASGTSLLARGSEIERRSLNAA